MQRRSFLGIVGGALASGPKAIANLTKSSLDLADVMPIGLGSYSDPSQLIDGSWAKRSLNQLKNLNPWVQAHQRRTFHISAIDPNTAALRSVSLSQKLRITHRVQYDAWRKNHQTYLEGVIAGFFD